MIFNSHTLLPRSANFIESIFHFSGLTPEHSIERVVPTGHIFILFELDNVPRNTFANETLEIKNTYNKAWISGIQKNYISISTPQHSEMLVIQLKPFGAFPYLHIPIHEITDKIVSGEKIFGDSIFELRGHIISTKRSEDKMALAEEWLVQRMDEDKIPSAELLDVMANLEKEPVTNLKNIIDSYPYTQKHLIEQFKKYVGVNPKYYQRILRFNEILAQLNQHKKISWTQVAYHCGYTDQSHFIKEFKHFSGFNPMTYIHNGYEKEEPNFFPLD